MITRCFPILLGGIFVVNMSIAKAADDEVRGSFQQKGLVSPHEVIGATIDGNPMVIVYGRPSSKDPSSGKIRKIWGEVVPYGEPWCTGDDDATLFCTTRPIKMGDSLIPPGAYVLYTVIEEKGPSKLFVSMEIGKQGTPIDRENDLAEIEMKKEALDKPVDRFTIAIEKTQTGGVLKLMWEKTQFSVPFTVPAKGAVDLSEVLAKTAERYNAQFTNPSMRGAYQQHEGAASPHEATGATIDGNPMIVVYGRPHSKDAESGDIRKIWGELVPYGQPWRTGSDAATLFCTGLPIVMGDKTIPPGAYVLYTIPEENGPSRLFISKEIGQRGIPVKRDNDLAEIELKKEALAKQVDQFTIAVEKSATGGVLKLMWENTQFSAPFTVKKKN